MGSRRGRRGYDDRQLLLPFNKQEAQLNSKIVNFRNYANARIQGTQENVRQKIIDRLVVSADKLDW
jgi:hypothetical protein